MGEDLTVRESVVEAYLVRRLQELRREYPKYRALVKKIGGMGWRGWTDRIVLFAGGCVHWIELKRPKNGRFEPLQLRRHALLRKMGFCVRVINTKRQVDQYIRDIMAFGPRDVT
jgi:hypothetical protein